MEEFGLTHNLGFAGKAVRIIALQPKKAVDFQEKNISNAKITGVMSNIHKLGKANIISSSIDSLKATRGNFNNSDIKDSRFVLSTFESCNFNHASHNNNWILDCTYSECSFSQTSITLSDFTNCTFINCDFSNVIISDCRFVKCTFNNCTTSNKMVESSLLFDCSFKMMAFEIDFISGNFGLSKDNLTDCTIGTHNNVKKTKISKLDPVQFVSTALKKETNSIQRFKLEYFLSPSITSDGSEEMDSLFNIEDWLRLCQNPNRFKLYIEKLHEFLLYQFDNNKLRLRTLIRLFEISAQLSNTISKRPDLIDIQRTIDGVFITIERILEQYFSMARILLSEFEEDGFCRILVEGPLDIAYYDKELKDLLNFAPVRFGKIIKHNSPNELYLHWENIKNLWPWIMFIFSTKFKFDLIKLDKTLNSVKTKAKHDVRGGQILKIESGFLDKSDTFSFRLQTLLPGYTELTLVIGLSASRYKKLIRIAKGILAFGKSLPSDRLL
jgi:uncharacterized protein YjbI with pentapeptide repeats